MQPDHDYYLIKVCLIMDDIFPPFMNDSIKGLNVKKPKHVFFDIFLLILYRRLQYANHRSCLPYENVNLSLNLRVFEESIMMIDRVIIIVDNVQIFWAPLPCNMLRYF